MLSSVRADDSPGEEGDHCKDEETGSDAPPTLEPVQRQQIDSIPNDEDDDDESAPEIPIAVEPCTSRCSPVTAISPITPPTVVLEPTSGEFVEDIPPQTDSSFPVSGGCDDGFSSVVAKRVEFRGDDDESMTATLEAAATTSEVEQDPICGYNRSQVDLMDEDTPLDFSMKKPPSLENGPGSCSPSPSPCAGDSSFETEGDGPLDLSVPRRKKSSMVHHDIHRQSKMARLDSIISKPSSPWGYCSPKTIPAVPGKPDVETTLWNGKVKHERSSVHYGSSSRHSSGGGGGASSVNVSLSLLQSAKAIPGVIDKTSSSSSSAPYEKVSDHPKCISKPEGFRAGNRQNPWQTQWMSRSSEQARDVFTCVWCRESFRSLAEMTVHMKQSPRCGMAGMQSSIPSTSPTPPVTTSTNSTPPAHQQPTTSKSSSASSTSSSSASGSSVLVKESMPLPRKLVRGQDVWLGKGAEQTRQILKCMWCGQSFKSLADMTTHMRVTQHYTNIISQEQIISWRTPEDKMTAQSQLNAVLTCKVCDQAFGSLKELTYHMVKNSHYKEHILRSITEGGGRRRQTRERRKKSLPVRKLLELERMELHKHTPKSSNQNHSLSPSKSEAAFGTITCEECAEKVDAKDFVQHIKSCGQGSKSQQLLKSALLSQQQQQQTSSSSKPIEGTGNCSSASVTPNSVSSASQDPHGEDSQSAKQPAPELAEQEPEKPCDGEPEAPGTTSVLNAIEKLIEKSFDSKGRRGGVPSAGILQRLGIDEEVCPPWHTSGSPNTLGVIRNGADMSLRQTTLSPSALRVTDFKDRSNGSMSDAGCRSPTSSTSSLMDDQNESGGLGISQTSVPNTLYLPSSQERQHRSSSRLTPHSKPPSPQLPTNLVVNQICKSSQEDDDAADSPESTRPASADNPTCLTVKTRNYEHHESESSKVSPRGAKESSGERANSEAGSVDDVTSSADAAVEKQDVDSSEQSSNKFSDRPSSAGARKNSESPCDSLSALRVKSPTESGNPASGEAVSSATSSGSDPPPNHPLRELQKLLDKTDAHLSRPNPQTSPGSILAFSWACSDAATSDSLMKCAFCETHFISKGAYRHHLSKMHFIKDGNVADSPTWKATQAGTTTTTTTTKTTSEVVSPKGSPSSSQEESPHTKFLKYTELAKQLSSKYV